MMENQDNDLTTLQAALKSGEMTAAQVEVVIEMLDDPAGQRRWLAATMVDQTLGDWCEVNEEGSRLAAVNPVVTRSATRRHWIVAVCAVVAGMLAIAMFVLPPLSSAVVRSHQFKIVSLSGSLEALVDGQWRVAQVGERLDLGTMVRTGERSNATLESNTEATTIRLHPQTQLQWSLPETSDPISGASVRLLSGQAEFDVAPQPAGRPMVIKSTTAVVEVLGTRLTTSVEPSLTEVSVQEGAVLVAPRNDQDARGRLIEAMERIAINSDGESTLHRTPAAQRLSLGLIGHWKVPDTRGPPDRLPETSKTLEQSMSRLLPKRPATDTRDGAEGFVFPSDYRDEASHVLRTGLKPLPKKFSISLHAWLAPECHGVQTLAANAACGPNTQGFKWYVHRIRTVNGKQRMQRDGSICVQMGTGQHAASVRTGPGVATEGRWHHFVLTVDTVNARGKIYVDGLDHTKIDRVLPGIQDAESLRLAGMAGFDPHLFDGLLDEIRVYSRLLSTEEIVLLGSKKVKP